MRQRAPYEATVPVATGSIALAEMPRHDVERHCDSTAQIGGEYGVVMYGGCFEVEQSAYDAVKGRWDGLPDEMRGHCDTIARLGGSGSYSILEGCVQMEEHTSSSPRTFDY